MQGRRRAGGRAAGGRPPSAAKADLASARAAHEGNPGLLLQRRLLLLGRLLKHQELPRLAVAARARAAAEPASVAPWSALPWPVITKRTGRAKHPQAGASAPFDGRALRLAATCRTPPAQVESRYGGTARAHSLRRLDMARALQSGCALHASRRCLTGVDGHASALRILCKVMSCAKVLLSHPQDMLCHVHTCSEVPRLAIPEARALYTEPRAHLHSHTTAARAARSCGRRPCGDPKVHQPTRAP